MAVLVDTNVILDVITNDPVWTDWSINQLAACSPQGLVINPAIYAELCFGYDMPAEVDDLLRNFGLALKEVPRLGLFKAAKAFRQYKSRAGSRDFVLPDFFIGGHAEAASMPLLTRDAKRYTTYFPSVKLISP